MRANPTVPCTSLWGTLTYVPLDYLYSLPSVSSLGALPVFLFPPSLKKRSFHYRSFLKLHVFYWGDSESPARCGMQDYGFKASTRILLTLFPGCNLPSLSTGLDPAWPSLSPTPIGSQAAAPRSLAKAIRRLRTDSSSGRPAAPEGRHPRTAAAWFYSPPSTPP